MGYIITALFGLWVGAIIGFFAATILRMADDSDFTGDQV